ncbi:hypothetical protein LTR36_000330 [Oleoguttula mirabilis]|uniref:Uncharacterized protein n=1 Tax=Oleoguttula mirabilis TaxID=1507867 RepID=A0AAV9JYT3_9PEZI|nr:hypothetical protein LTR36_000330 [Oleoguttula mirabilis]
MGGPKKRASPALIDKERSVKKPRSGGQRRLRSTTAPPNAADVISKGGTEATEGKSKEGPVATKASPTKAHRTATTKPRASSESQPRKSKSPASAKDGQPPTEAQYVPPNHESPPATVGIHSGSPSPHGAETAASTLVPESDLANDAENTPDQSPTTKASSSLLPLGQPSLTTAERHALPKRVESADDGRRVLVHIQKQWYAGTVLMVAHAHDVPEKAVTQHFALQDLFEMLPLKTAGDVPAGQDLETFRKKTGEVKENDVVLALAENL